MTYHDSEFEPAHQGTATDHYLTELQLYGYRPSLEEPDPRPLPEDVQVEDAVMEIMDALVGTLDNTPMEADLEALLWGAVSRAVIPARERGEKIWSGMAPKSANRKARALRLETDRRSYYGLAVETSGQSEDASDRSLGRRLADFVKGTEVEIAPLDKRNPGLDR